MTKKYVHTYSTLYTRKNETVTYENEAVFGSISKEAKWSEWSTQNFRVMKQHNIGIMKISNENNYMKMKEKNWE